MSKKKGDTKHIEIIARGVCVQDGRLLVCHTKGAANTYLPGGHVEFGESAVYALSRELNEELGITCTVGPFLGSVEHTFFQKGDEHCEINLVFAFKMPAGNVEESPTSCEDYIEFHWLDIGTLNDSNLEPSILRSLIPSTGTSDTVPWWGSTFPDGGGGSWSDGVME